jgi:hypothetical protein
MIASEGEGEEETDDLTMVGLDMVVEVVVVVGVVRVGPDWAMLMIGLGESSDILSETDVINLSLLILRQKLSMLVLQWPGNDSSNYSLFTPRN